MARAKVNKNINEELLNESDFGKFIKGKYKVINKDELEGFLGPDGDGMSEEDMQKEVDGFVKSGALKKIEKPSEKETPKKATTTKGGNPNPSTGTPEAEKDPEIKVSIQDEFEEEINKDLKDGKITTTEFRNINSFIGKSQNRKDVASLLKEKIDSIGREKVEAALKNPSNKFEDKELEFSVKTIALLAVGGLQKNLSHQAEILKDIGFGLREGIPTVKSNSGSLVLDKHFSKLFATEEAKPEEGKETSSPEEQKNKDDELEKEIDKEAGNTGGSSGKESVSDKGDSTESQSIYKTGEINNVKDFNKRIVELKDQYEEKKKELLDLIDKVKKERLESAKTKGLKDKIEKTSLEASKTINDFDDKILHKIDELGDRASGDKSITSSGKSITQLTDKDFEDRTNIWRKNISELQGIIINLKSFETRSKIISEQIKSMTSFGEDFKAIKDKITGSSAWRNLQTSFIGRSAAGIADAVKSGAKMAAFNGMLSLAKQMKKDNFNGKGEMLYKAILNSFALENKEQRQEVQKEIQEYYTLLQKLSFAKEVEKTKEKMKEKGVKPETIQKAQKAQSIFKVE